MSVAQPWHQDGWIRGASNQWYRPVPGYVAPPDPDNEYDPDDAVETVYRVSPTPDEPPSYVVSRFRCWLPGSFETFEEAVAELDRTRDEP